MQLFIIELIINCCNDNGIPILGICVGMQMMAEGSEEGQMDGLGWVKGLCCAKGLGRVKG